jgi:hypothetical protein
MAVRWIGEAARALGISPLDAVEMLALHQNYPMNGLIDEDRFLFLRRYAQDRKGDAAASGSAPKSQKVPPPPPSPPAVKTESTGVTAPMQTQPDRAEERTVIIPPSVLNS